MPIHFLAASRRESGINHPRVTLESCPQSNFENSQCNRFKGSGGTLNTVRLVYDGMLLKGTHVMNIIFEALIFFFWEAPMAAEPMHCVQNN